MEAAERYNARQYFWRSFILRSSPSTSSLSFSKFCLPSLRIGLAPIPGGCRRYRARQYFWRSFILRSSPSASSLINYNFCLALLWIGLAPIPGVCPEVETQAVLIENLYSAVEPLSLLFEHLQFLTSPSLRTGLAPIPGGCRELQNQAVLMKELYSLVEPLCLLFDHFQFLTPLTPDWPRADSWRLPKGKKARLYFWRSCILWSSPSASSMSISNFCLPLLRFGLAPIPGGCRKVLSQAVLLEELYSSF